MVASTDLGVPRQARPAVPITSKRYPLSSIVPLLFLAVAGCEESVELECAGGCAPGERRCSGDELQSCEDLNGDGCAEWSAPVACDLGSCLMGACHAEDPTASPTRTAPSPTPTSSPTPTGSPSPSPLPTCTAERLGSTVCYPYLGVTRCAVDPVGGVPGWEAPVACPDGFRCREGACEGGFEPTEGCTTNTAWCFLGDAYNCPTRPGRNVGEQTRCHGERVCVDAACQPAQPCSRDTDCPELWICADDQCRPWSRGLHRIRVLFFNISLNRPDGQSWDSVGSNPDPFVRFVFNGERYELPVRTDTFEPRWEEAIEVSLPPRVTMRVEAFDADDFGADDLIFRTDSVPFLSEGQLVSGEFTLTALGDREQRIANLTLRIERL